MYYILYTNKANIPIWEQVSGEDAMNVRIDEIVKTGVDPEDITVIRDDGGNLSYIE